MIILGATKLELAPGSGESGIIASTTQTQGNGPLTKEINEISTVANPNDTVTLPSAEAFKQIIIRNDGANTVQIFPASGDDLGKGIDVPDIVESNSCVTFAASDFTDWNLISRLRNDISCKVTKSADQSIPNSTSTIITWDQEDYDTDGMHDNVTNNSRITIKTPGKYSVMAQFEWASNSTGKRIIDIMKNSVVLGKANYLASGNSQHTISFVDALVVGDILEVRVFQDSGGSLDFLNNITYFEAHKIN